MAKRVITVNDTMQRGYRYALTAATGRGFAPEFEPAPTSAAVLRF